LVSAALLLAAQLVLADDEWAPRPEDVEVIQTGPTVMYKYRDADGTMVVQGQPPPGFLNPREAADDDSPAGDAAPQPASALAETTTLPASEPPADTQALAMAALGALCLVAGLILALLKPVTRLLRETALERVVRQSGFPAFTGVQMPRQTGGDLNLEHVLCTPSGLLVLEAPDISGVVTGGPALPSWSCGSKTERVEVPNPLLQVQSNVAAVSELVGGVPVFGRVVLTEKVTFPLEPPAEVQTLKALRERLPGFAEKPTSERELGGAWRLLMRYPREADTLPAVPYRPGAGAWVARHWQGAAGAALGLAGIAMIGAALVIAA
ncbi:MAG: nuclease-related domain-containing protein, partial [Pseudomonadota bacterium]